MDQYKFSTEYNKMIVDAVVEGYRDYIEHRKERKLKMKISSAFAWTKGNFIESKLADDCSNYGFSYRKSKAGLTWDYLQFVHGSTKILFLIKNAAYFNPDCFSQAKIPDHTGNKERRTYLYELSEINRNLTFSEKHLIRKNGKKTEEVEQLSLFTSKSLMAAELEKVKAAAYTQFHIITYSIDDSYQIAEIMNYLPNPHDNIAYLVEDLSHFISGAELTDDERGVIAPEAGDENLDPDAFDIGILEDQQLI